MSKFTQVLNLNPDPNPNPDPNSDRYSRQSYAIGKDVQIKLSEAKVLVVGYNTLGQEIIKNLVLQGTSQIDIHFKNKLENYQKTGLYYPLIDNNIPLEEIRKLI